MNTPFNSSGSCWMPKIPASLKCILRLRKSAARTLRDKENAVSTLIVLTVSMSLS